MIILLKLRKILWNFPWKVKLSDTLLRKQNMRQMLQNINTIVEKYLLKILKTYIYTYQHVIYKRQHIRNNTLLIYTSSSAALLS